MPVQIKKFNQKIVIYRGEYILYSALIADLDRIFLFMKRHSLSYHVIQASKNPRKELLSLYQLGKIIQIQYPESINSIHWALTYFYVEYEDYIDKIARIEMSEEDDESEEYANRLAQGRFDLSASEKHYDAIVDTLNALVKCRLREFGIQTPNTR